MKPRVDSFELCDRKVMDRGSKILFAADSIVAAHHGFRLWNAELPIGVACVVKSIHYSQDSTRREAIFFVGTGHQHGDMEISVTVTVARKEPSLSAAI